MITLYQMPHSPLCIPVRMILDAVKAPLQIRNVSSGNRAELITLTDGAYYQVPVILDERDGRRLVHESNASSQDVARFLDEEFAGGRLFPSRLEGIQEIILHHLEDEVEGLTFRIQDSFYINAEKDLVERVMMIRHKERKFGKNCVEKWRNTRSEMLDEAVRMLLPYEKMLGHSEFLLGSEPVYSDYLLAGILGNITYGGHNSLPDVISLLRDFNTRLEAYCFV